jgi:MFS family permease
MRSTLAPLLSLLLGIAFLITGHGLQITLIPLRAAAEGWSPLAIGVIGSAYFVGFVLGCLAAPFVILRAGHIRAFAALVALCAATTLCQALLVAVTPWILFRLIIGASLAGLYLIIESWLNDRATNANRGLIMSAYIVVNFAAIAAGQFLATAAPATEFTLFAVASLFISLATIPVVLTGSEQPAPVQVVRFRPAALYRASPVGLVGVTVIGVANGAFWSLAAIYALGQGLTAEQAAVFVGFATIGGAVAQWPAGRISDRIDRRMVLIALLSAGVVIGLLLAVLPVAGVLWVPLAILFGMATLPTYSIAAAHAYDHAERDAYVETAAGILLANGAGSIVGPILAAALMEASGTAALFLFTAAAQGALALFVLNRLSRRSAPASEAKTDFDLSATAPVGPTIPPEFHDPGDRHVPVIEDNQVGGPLADEKDAPPPEAEDVDQLKLPIAIPGPVGLRGNKV